VKKAVEVHQAVTSIFCGGRNGQVLESWWHGNVVSKLVGYINATEHTMDVGVSGVTQDDVGQAVLAAFDRHVKIRLYTHLRRVRPEPKWIQKFIDYGIPVRHAPWTEEQTMPVDSDEDDSFPEMCIIDRSIYMMGSRNWSREALEGVFNVENSMILKGDCGKLHAEACLIVQVALSSHAHVAIHQKCSSRDSSGCGAKAT
jgi:hypothetical protein